MSDGADKSKRDLVLAKVLERLSEHIQEYNVRLEEIEKKQHEIFEEVKNFELHYDIRLNESLSSFERLNQSMQRYRSDMLGLVNEQDRLNEFTKELAKRQTLISGAQEKILQNMSFLESRYKVQEKTAHDHYSHSLEQADTFARELADAKHSVVKLQAATEKRLTEMHTDVNKHIERIRKDTMDRLLALDGIEAALSTILIRTEPPEKKPFWLARVFKRLHWSLKSGFSRMAARIRLYRKR